MTAIFRLGDLLGTQVLIVHWFTETVYNIRLHRLYEGPMVLSVHT